MWCTSWLFSPMGTVLRQTYPGFLWTQKWKSINNLNFFKENFSSLVDIQAWLQLNSKIEFSECFFFFFFWMHYKLWQTQTSNTMSHRETVLKKIHTLPFQVHIKMRQLNCSNIYLRHGPGMPSHIICAVFMRFWKQIYGQTKKSPIKWNKYFIS